jgi:hypothetical protein
MKLQGDKGALPALMAVLALALAGPLAHADAEWLRSGDIQMRLDLQLLNDAEIIRYPVNQWPIPRAAIVHAMEKARRHLATNAAVIAALARVDARLERGRSRLSVDATLSGGQPGLWRDFDTVAREEGELSVAAGYSHERFAASLSVTGVANPDDGQEIRFDDSHVTAQLGNWLVSANSLDRWWGPGHQGSLILSNNARPMPTLMVERAAAMPFENKWLSWLGPWRFSFGISRMEGERDDIDRPLFMAWRVVVMPFKDIELGFSRTAQFCGEQLSCSWNVFWNMIAGNDNVGIDATPENEPGNQMAGFDLRWASPIGSWPYAVYAQMIGEDESSYLPAKYLSQFGLEAWKPTAAGGLVQMFAEYATTTCSAHTDRGPYYNCAYTQGRFNADGYRYRGRVIGYPSDRDAENWALGATYTTPDGSLWSATARTSRLNRDDFGDPVNLVAQVPTSYDALEFGWRGRLAGGDVGVELGVQSLEPAMGERDIEGFGFIRWRHDFEP